MRTLSKSSRGAYLLFFSLLLPACDAGNIQRCQQAQRGLAETEQKLNQLATALQTEKERRTDAERRADQAQKKADTAGQSAFYGWLSTVIIFFIGVAMGASTRLHAERKEEKRVTFPS